MTSKVPRRAVTCCLASAALLAGTSPARADDAVATIARDTPISAYGGIVAWSAYDAADGQYALEILRGGGSAAAPIPGARAAFDVSLGPDARGRVVALYTRCLTASGHGCDVYRYDVAARTETKVVAASSPSQDEAWPVQWGDRLAFVRRAKVYGVPVEGSAHGLRPDPRGQRGGGPLVECDIPYVKILSSRAPSRALDRGVCAPTTGMSIRGDRIVQVTDVETGDEGSESEVRLLAAEGGSGRVLARAGGGGAGGYSPFSSPSQSAAGVWLTRTGTRIGVTTGFARIDVASARLTVVPPNVDLTGSVARDNRGTFWYVEAPVAPELGLGYAPFCVSPLAPCRLVRASASPFTLTPRTLPPRLRVVGGLEPDTLFTDPLSISGDLTRTVVRGGAVVARQPVPGVALTLAASPESLYGAYADESQPVGPFAATGLQTTTDQSGQWSFGLGARLPATLYAALAPVLDLASPVVSVTTAARVTLTAAGTSLAGTVTPAQPGRTVNLQLLRNNGSGDGCAPPDASGQLSCHPAAWITVATPALVGGTAFSATIAQPGIYRADLPPGPNAGTAQANPADFDGDSLQIPIPETIP